jgi:hypothetical protein
MTIERSEFLFLGSKQVVWIKGARNILTGDYLNAATAHCTIYDDEGIVVVGAESISMAYKAASNGEYYGIMPSSVSLVVDECYTVEVVLNQAGDDRTIRWQARAIYGGTNDS